MENKKRYTILWFLIFVVFTVVFMIIAINFLQIKIEFPQKIQKNYAEYLIKENDSMITSMMNFNNLIKKPKRVFSSEEKDKITKNIEEKNNIMKDLQKHAPNNNNKDYIGLYKDILKTYAMYIQGETMKMEFISAYKKEYTPEEKKQGLEAKEETYVMGEKLCDMMGNIILENTSAINKIGNTNIKSKYNPISIEKYQKNIQSTT